MTFRDAVLPALARADAVVGRLGLAPVQAQIITLRWSQGERGRGDAGLVGEPLSLPNSLFVRAVGVREIAQSNGRFEMGDIRLFPIRPTYTNPSLPGPASPGGFSVQQLDPRLVDESMEAIYRLSQTVATGTGYAGDYTLIELVRTDPLEFQAIVRRHMSPSDIPQTPTVLTPGYP